MPQNDYVYFHAGDNNTEDAGMTWIWADIIWSSSQKTYGKRVAEALAELWTRGELELVFSPTGSLRAIRRRAREGKGAELAYYNPVRGVLTLSMEGALTFFPLIDKGRKRIVVSREDFCRYTGGSLLAPIVRRISNDVRPGDEVFIVDEGDNLLGVGKSLISSIELMGMKRGEVAKVRRKVGCGD